MWLAASSTSHLINDQRLPCWSEVRLATTISESRGELQFQIRLREKDVYFGNMDLSRFHSNQHHPRSKRHLYLTDEFDSLSTSEQSTTEAKSMFSETPKLNEQLQRHSQAAELGHRIRSST